MKKKNFIVDYLTTKLMMKLRRNVPVDEFRERK
jgi:hypothetical protein